MPPKPEYFHDLKEAVRLVERAVEALRERQQESRSEVKQLRETVETSSKQIAVLEQRLGEIAKRIDENDRRWWGLVTLFAGALLSLASGLIVTLAKK